MEKQGILIILEAGDASGKETQTRLLYERLLTEGRDVTRVSFPDYGSDSSALVRMYLRGDFGAQAADVDAYAASAFSRWTATRLFIRNGARRTNGAAWSSLTAM